MRLWRLLSLYVLGIVDVHEKIHQSRLFVSFVYLNQQMILSYHNILRRGSGVKEVKVEDILAEIAVFKDRLLKFSKSSFEIAKDLQKLNNIMFEGAQGALLDVGFGTYPFVTSSNCIAAQASIGCGVGMKYLQDVFMVSKAYCTRVGDGPFPTEASIMEQEIIRQKGFEYGATTKRPRRCGWIDLPALKYASRLNGATGLLLTKLDILSEIGPIKICIGYKDQEGVEISNFSEVLKMLQEDQKVNPIYEVFDSLPKFSEQINSINDLPIEARKIFFLIEKELKIPIRMLSFGKERGKEIYFN